MDCYKIAATGFVLLTVFLTSSCRTSKVYNSFPETKEIRVFTEEKNLGAGILVRIPTPIPISGADSGTVTLEFVNLFQEEVFLDVGEYQGLGLQAKGRYSGSSGYVGHIKTMLHLLEGSIWKDGRYSGSDCCAFTSIQGRLETPINLNEWANIENITVPIAVSGYFRHNGQRFYGKTEIPVSLERK